MAFIFNPQTGETPQGLRAKREIAAALMRSRSAPKNLGEGLNELGNALAFRFMQGDIDRGERYGQDQAASRFAPILGALQGGQPQPTASPPPQAIPNPALQNPTLDGVQKSALPAEIQAPAPEMPKSRAEFLERIKPMVLQAAAETGIDPSIIAAQAVHESAWGTKAPGNNLFGIKGAGDAGTQNFATHENIGGRNVAMRDNFAAYSSPEASVMGYADFINKNPRYGKMKAAKGRDAQIAELARSGYATDPQYGNKISRIASQINFDGGGSIQPAGGPMPQQQPGDIDLGVLMQAASDPWLAENPMMMGIVNNLLEQKMKSSDPMTQLQLRKAQLELNQLENPQQDPKKALELEKLRLENEQLKNPKSDPFTLQPGDIRFDGTGKLIASGGEKPKDNKAPNVETFYDEQGNEYKAQWDEAIQDWKPVGKSKKKSDGIVVETLPDGTTRTIVGGSGKPLNDTQSKNVIFATRARGALERFEPNSTALTEITGSTIGQIPGVGNYAKSNGYQLAEQAGTEFLHAILRKDTGAAVTPDEKREYGAVYLPAMGDGPDVQLQKKEARQRAVVALEAGMSPQEILAQEGALAKGAKAPAGEPIIQDGYTIEKVE